MIGGPCDIGDGSTERSLVI